jgi:hypothetical protein
MKTIAIIAAALIMFSTSFSFAETNKRTLTIVDSFGRMLSMPVKVEEAAEELPFDQTAIVRQSRIDHVSRIFDISCMSKPETAEEIPAELKGILGK